MNRDDVFLDATIDHFNVVFDRLNEFTAKYTDLLRRMDVHMTKQADLEARLDVISERLLRLERLVDDHQH